MLGIRPTGSPRYPSFFFSFFYPSSASINVPAGDLPQLISALAQMGAAGGGVVRLAAGTTVIGPPTLTVPGRVSLIGGGTDATVLLLAAGTKSTVAVAVGAAAQGARLADLTVTVDSACGTVVEIPALTRGSEVVRVAVNGTAKAATLPRGPVRATSETL